MPRSAGANVLRAGSSRILGFALIASSAILYVVSFITSFLPFEVASLVSFVLGVALLAVELEPRVKLSSTAAAMLGSLKALDGALAALKARGKATYVPRGTVVSMAMAQEKGPNLELPPVSQGVYEEIAEELGDISQKGESFYDMWIPRVLVENLAMTEDVKILRQGGSVKVSMKKPFVRRLCVDPFVNANVCCRMGCPLAGGVAQALAAATARDVQFEGCTYDPRTQRALITLTER